MGHTIKNVEYLGFVVNTLSVDVQCFHSVATSLFHARFDVPVQGAGADSREGSLCLAYPLFNVGLRNGLSKMKNIGI